MKKIKALVLIFLFSSSTFIFAQTKKTALEIRDEALKQSDVKNSIEYIKKNIGEAQTLSDTRSLWYFTGCLEEQCGLYEDAATSYVKAAGIGASDATGFVKVSSEQIVLCAVRSCLCAGDSESADRYLNSAVRSSKDENVIAFVNLYSLWSSLSKALSEEEEKDSIALLNAYILMDSMKSVRPQLLLTLWYLNADTATGERLKKEYPLSPEAKIVEGKVNLAVFPFWLFTPHKTSLVE
jgi:tetratricopeptide (TPR) repeat protein